MKLSDRGSIIFVHGLGSNPDSTWRATKHATRQATTADIPEEAATDNEQFVNWVSDFLPSDLLPAVSRDVRLFFYNYDSYWKRDAVHTRLTNLGNELLEHIGGIRMSETVGVKIDPALDSTPGALLTHSNSRSKAGA